MTTNIRVLPWCLLITIWAGFIPAGAGAQSKVGTTAAQFLGVPVGPRAIAMGGAYVAANQDVAEAGGRDGGGAAERRIHRRTGKPDQRGGGNREPAAIQARERRQRSTKGSR